MERTSIHNQPHGQVQQTTNIYETADKGIQDSVYKVLTAFANKDGGTLIIGMNEADGLVGVEFRINNRKNVGNMADP